LRKKKAIRNTIFSLLLNIVTIIYGFIIPRIIIKNYGTEVNGLLTSITQYFSYLILLQAGVGGVIKAKLYKPLAYNNTEEINTIINTTRLFFKKLSLFTILYTIILVFVFPFIIKTNVRFSFTSTLIIIISIQSVSQYYLGITNQILLTSDQNEYIYSLIQITVLIINTIVTYLLVFNNVGIHIVTLANSIVYLLKPVLLHLIVSKKYNINQYNSNNINFNLLKERWDGLGHTLAYFIHSKIDIFLISIYLGVSEVSVYSIYIMIVNGVKILITTISSALESSFGNIISMNQQKTLNSNFKYFLLIINSLIVILFSSTFVLIIPFITIYTQGFNDYNYINCTLAFLIIISELIYAFRQPYASLIVSAGHYKETKRGAYIEALLNVVLSLIFIRFWKLNGLIIATIIAMTYRLLDNMIYLSKNIINIDYKNYLFRYSAILGSFFTIFVAYYFYHRFIHEVKSYFSWIVLAIVVVIVNSIITLSWQYIFYKKDFKELFIVFKKLIYNN